MRFGCVVMMFLGYLFIGSGDDRTSAQVKIAPRASNPSAVVGQGLSSSTTGVEITRPLGSDSSSSLTVPSDVCSSCGRPKDTSHSTGSTVEHHEVEHGRRSGLIFRIRRFISKIRVARGLKRKSRMQRLRSTGSQH